MLHLWQQQVSQTLKSSPGHSQKALRCCVWQQQQLKQHQMPNTRTLWHEDAQ
jgi:hypothetical protein